MQTFSVLLVVALTPIFGLPLYLLSRPRSTLAERYYEEMSLSEEWEGGKTCGKCGNGVGEDFRFCPHCREELLDVCPSCGGSKEKDWKHCPWCGSSEKEPKTAKAAEPVKKPSKPKKEEKAESPAAEAAPKETSEEKPEASEGKKPRIAVTLEEIPEAGK